MHSVTISLTSPGISGSYSEIEPLLMQWQGKNSTALSSKDNDAVSEIKRRLERLEGSRKRLLLINDELCSLSLPKVHFDQVNDVVSFTVGETTSSIKLQRADPNVPLTMRPLGAVGAYSPSAPPPNETSQQTRLKAELEELLEQHYYNAHRILKLVQKLPKCRNFKCKEIAIVRNKLVEHADHGDIYSFGFGTQGPLVRPMVPLGRDWVDAGLIPNTASFVSALSEQFRDA